MEFTVQMLFDLTIGIIGDQKSNSDGYKENFIPMMNTVLSECLEHENALRERDSMEIFDGMGQDGSLSCGVGAKCVAVWHWDVSAFS